MSKKLFVLFFVFLGFICFPALSFKPFKCNDIKIRGLHLIDSHVALNIDLKTNDLITSEKVASLIDEMYATGNYKDISFSKDSSNNLIITVVENPMVSEVTYSGNDKLDDDMVDKVLEDQGLIKGSIYSYKRMAMIEEIMKSIYLSNGMYNSIVNVNVIEQPRNRVKINIEMIESSLSEISLINIIGNKNISHEEILSVMSLTKDESFWDFFTDKKYQSEKLTADLESIKNLYMSRGYLDFKIVSNNVYLSENKRQVFLTINIDEGELYTVNSIKIFGMEELGYNADIASYLISKDSTYNLSAVSFIENDIKAHLNSLGYYSSDIDIVTKKKQGKNVVDLFFNIDVGVRNLVRRVIFEGNKSTSNFVILREFRQYEGTWLNQSMIEISKQRINRMGFFDHNIDVKVVNVAGSADKVDIIVDLKEASTGKASLTVSYGGAQGSSSNHLSFTASLSDRNIFGTGNSGLISGTFDKTSMSAKVAFSDPYFTDKGVSLSNSFSISSEDTLKTEGVSDYKTTFTRLASSIGIPLSEIDRVNLSLSAEFRGMFLASASSDQSAHFYYTYGNSASNISASKMKFSDISLSLNWVRSTLIKHGVFPVKGYSIHSGASVTIPGVSNLQYYKFNASYDHYFPLNNRKTWVLGYSASVGYIDAFGKNDKGIDHDVPIWKKSYLGGANTVRGFMDNSIGPKEIYLVDNANKNYCIDSYSGGFCNVADVSDDVSVIQGTKSSGGNAYYYGSFVFAFPFPFLDIKYQSSLRPSLFLDYGNLWDTNYRASSYSAFNREISGVEKSKYKLVDYSSFKDIRVSVGIDLKWFTPANFLIQVGYSKALRAKAGDREKGFYFTLGGGF